MSGFSKWGHTATRAEVYAALDSERAYQATRWNAQTTDTAGHHDTIEEWLVYMQSYLTEAMNQIARSSDQVGKPLALASIRKITALGVAAMEDLGAPRREGF